MPQKMADSKKKLKVFKKIISDAAIMVEMAPISAKNLLFGPSISETHPNSAATVVAVAKLRIKNTPCA